MSSDVNAGGASAAATPPDYADIFACEVLFTAGESVARRSGTMEISIVAYQATVPATTIDASQRAAASLYDQLVTISPRPRPSHFRTWQLFANGSSQILATQHSDARGQFWLRGLATGSYRLRRESIDERLQRMAADLSLDEHVDLFSELVELELERKALQQRRCDLANRTERSEIVDRLLVRIRYMSYSADHRLVMLVAVGWKLRQSLWTRTAEYSAAWQCGRS